MRKQPIIIGNWKMYKTSSEAVQFIKQLIPTLSNSKAKVGLAVPFTSIEKAVEAAKDSGLLIGAQNMNDASEGAFTGEIASRMLKNAGASFVLLGHSERRHIFHEDDEVIHAKVLRALDDEITPILCVGETMEERQKGHEEVLDRQVREGLREVPKNQCEKVIVAYEPVWAIGTGQTATPALAGEAHAHIRLILSDLFGKTKAAKIPILYGGSVKPENAKDLMKQKDIQGALVGGASLNPKTFAEIVTLS